MAQYQSTKETSENLKWADLVVLDLSLYDQPGGKDELVQKLKRASETTGFFYLVNHGIEQSAVNQQFELAESIFALPTEVKSKFILQPGRIGYKPAGSLELIKGVKDNVEMFDDPKYNQLNVDFARPEPCQRLCNDNKEFCAYIHNTLLRRLLVLAAMSLELSDLDTLWKQHNYETASDCHMRYMAHRPRTVKEQAIIRDNTDPNKATIPGHTDFGTFTFLFRQPVAGLQIRVAENEWQWVKPLKDSIIVNVADTLSFMTGGRMKSSIHRVISPPEDQSHITRLSVIYFTRPDDNVVIKACVDESDAARDQSIELPKGVRTVEDWVLARYKNPFNYKTGQKEKL